MEIVFDQENNSIPNYSVNNSEYKFWYRAYIRELNFGKSENEARTIADNELANIRKFIKRENA